MVRVAWDVERWPKGRVDSEVDGEPASFGEYFLEWGLAEGEQHFLVLERVQESDVVLMIDNNDGEDGP